jgi:MFS family permease
VSQTISLREIEGKAWMSVFQDGLWDIYLGLLLLSMGMAAWLSDRGAPEGWYYGTYIALILLAMLVLRAGKRYVTVPRMGRFRPGPKGRARQRKAVILLALSVVVGAVVFALALALRGSRAGWLNPRILLGMGYTLNMLIVFSLGAYFLRFERLYLIGLMFALPVPLDIALSELAGIDLGCIAFVVPAAVILIVGAVVFVRFLREYRLP